jgi:mannose-6-phosphate isomerase
MKAAVLEPKIWPLENGIQEYEWGSREAIAELLGRPVPSAKPQAELWMGAHPVCPSMVRTAGAEISLMTLIEEHPVELLGDGTARRFNSRLPFLFKVLAAAQPLSIQAHPNLTEAREGFAREESLGIPLNSRLRSYKDDNHKPELIYALTPFRLMQGFRAPSEILSLLSKLNIKSIRGDLEVLKGNLNAIGFRELFARLISLTEDRRRTLSREISEMPRNAGPESEWLQALNSIYPGDPGVLAPMLLNLVELKSGEALFLQAGQLHAYLEGTGLELMANSDNVLRGGLTPKHVDAQELLRILSFDETRPNRIVPGEGSRGEMLYRTPADEFLLTELELARQGYESEKTRSLEIWIVVEGRCHTLDRESGESASYPRGSSFLIPAAVPAYRLTGPGRLFRASVPLAGAAPQA